MVGFVAPAVAWYRDRRGQDVLLPASAVVSLPSLLAAGSGGRFAIWRLPSGGHPVDNRRLPLGPVDVDKVFPLGAADVPWSAGGAALTRDWQSLFRERAAFEPWGDALDDGLLRLYQRQNPPRTTFRAGPGRRDLRFLYPQFVPASRAYRLGAGYFKLAEPLRRACQTLVADGEHLRLVSGGRVERLRADGGAGGIQALAASLETGGAFWTVEPPEAHSPLLIVPH